MMKGGFVLVLGIIVIIAVMVLLFAIVVCTSPGSASAPYCSPFSPVVEMFKDTFSGIG